MSTHSQCPSLVIYNGASRLQWSWDHPRHLVFGCNFAYRDWPLTHCWAVDRMTVAAIRGHDEYPDSTCEFWTKQTGLELPPRWQHRPCPGIDSGSAAVSHALSLSLAPVIVIGADGVCGGDTDTAYDYRWHGPNAKRQIHHRHRQTLIELSQENPGRIFLVWDHPVDRLQTISLAQAKSMFDKYEIIENKHGQTSYSQTKHQRQ